MANKHKGLNKRSSRLHLLKTAVFAVLMGLAGQQLLRFSMAASGPTLYINPASSTVLRDNAFNLEIRLDSAGQQVDGVEAFMTYPADKLQFVGISDANSAFGLTFPSSGGAGKITIRRTVNPDSSPTVSSSSLLVATVTMRAIVGSGTAPVTYDANSRVTAPSAGNGNVLANRAGGNYNLSVPPSASTPTNQPTSPSSTNNTTTTPSNRNSAQQPRNTTNTPNTSPTPSVNNATPATDQPGANSSEQPAVTPAENHVPSPSEAAVKSNQAVRRNPLPLIAKALGIILIIGSIFMVIRWVLAYQHHRLIPAGAAMFSGPQAYVGGSAALSTTPALSRKEKLRAYDEPIVVTPTNHDNSTHQTPDTPPTDKQA